MLAVLIAALVSPKTYGQVAAPPSVYPISAPLDNKTFWVTGVYKCAQSFCDSNTFGDPASACKQLVADTNAGDGLPYPADYIGNAPGYYRDGVTINYLCYGKSRDPQFWFLTPIQVGYVWLNCIAFNGTVVTYGSLCRKNPPPPPVEVPCISPKIGNPVDLITGFKQDDDIDFENLDGSLIIRRSYNSAPSLGSGASSLGPAWRGLVPGEASVSTGVSVVLDIVQSDGSHLAFTRNSSTGNWSGGSYYGNLVHVTLTPLFAVPGGTSWLTFVTSNPVNWRLSYGDGRSYILSASAGPPTYDQKQVVYASATSPTGATTSFIYVLGGGDRSPNRLSKIVTQNGQALTINWTGSLPGSIGLPDGQLLAYAYEAPTGGMAPPDRLVSVKRMLGANIIWSKNYLYESTVYPYALTGRVDALGVRRTIYRYNDYGQVIETGKADGSEKVTLVYPPVIAGTSSIARTVTNAAGKISHFTFIADTIPTSLDVTNARYSGQADDSSSLTPARSTAVTFAGTGATATIGSVSDYRGTPTAFTYDPLYRPVTATLASGATVQRVETTTWDPVFDNPTHEVLSGRTVDYTYDTLGRPLTRTETDATTTSVPYATAGQTRTWTYAWTTFGKLDHVVGSRSATGGHTDLTSYTYDTSNNLLSVTNALGQMTTFSGYDVNGRPGRMVEANGRTTDYVYDPVGRLSTRTVRGGSGGDAVTSLTYDLEGQLIAITPPASDTLFIDYTPVGRVADVRDAMGARIDYQYDLLGNRTVETTKRSDSIIRRTVTRVFDDLSRLTSLTLGPGRTASYAYDLNDNPVKTVDARNNATKIAFDALDRVAATVDPLNGTTVIASDGQDNVAGHTDRINVTTTYVRDGFGEVISEVSPDRGTSVYTYNSGGDLIQSIDGRGQVVTYDRDILGRITARHAIGVPGQDVTYTYDTSFVGALAVMTDASGTTSFTYDARGNVVSRALKIGTKFAGSLAFTYDAGDRVATVTYPSGRIVTYARDARGRVAGVSLQQYAAATAISLASAMTYDAFGPLTSVTLGNGLSIKQSFGSDDRLYARALTGPVGGLWSKTYAYDNDDNITGIADTLKTSSSTSLQYDALSRLTRATGQVNASAREDYRYDANDNRTLMERRLKSSNAAPDSTATSSLVSGSNRLDHVTDTLTGTRAFTYDGHGAVASDTTTPAAGAATTLPLRYDAYGRLVYAATTATSSFAMLYDGLDQRVQVTIDGTPRNFVYDGSGRLIGEYGATPLNIYAEHVWLDPDASEQDGWQPLAMLGVSTTYWVMSDHRGAPVLLTDTSGAIANSYALAPFGQRFYTLHPTPTTSLQLPGQIGDLSTRFYNRYRDYDPTLGRYLEADPIGLAGGENVYGYVGENPLGRVDPLGLAYPGPVSPGASTNSCPIPYTFYLEARKTLACAPIRTCTAAMSCEDLQAQITHRMNCAGARQRIMSECYSGGDDGHRLQVEQMFNGIAACQKIMQKKACGCPTF